MPAGTLHGSRSTSAGGSIAGVSADTLLFGFRNPLTGNLEGFDIDMVRQVAQAIFGDPNRVEYKVLTYAAAHPGAAERRPSTSSPT